MAKDRIGQHFNAVRRLESLTDTDQSSDSENDIDNQIDAITEAGGKSRKKFYSHMNSCPSSDQWTWTILDSTTKNERFRLEAAERKFFKIFKPLLNTQLAY